MATFEKFEKSSQRLEELEKLLADPKVISDQAQYQKTAKEYAELVPVVTAYRKLMEVTQKIEKVQRELKETSDADLKELAQSELDDFNEIKAELEKKLKELSSPKRQESNRNLIFEIRAGTGGEEASLFAADLYRMYTKYADKKRWTVEAISSNESETGGFKEIIFSVSGPGAEKHLKWESGGHRVQRVPATEASGRIHTSAATVAVLFEPEEVDIQIEPKDLKIDVFRSSGPGGQSVNTTDSAVRITHLPSGLVVVCQDERSQLKNRYKAMRVLRARLHDLKMQQQYEQESRDRKLKVGSGDRSEKIRTYNYPDRRITDHRIGFTTYKLQMVLDGELDEITQALIAADEEEQLNESK